MTSVIAVAIVVVKAVVWTTAIIDMAVVVEVSTIDVMADVEIIVTSTATIVLKFASSVSYSVDVPSKVAVDLFMDALSGAMILGVLTGIVIGKEVFADANANIFSVVMTGFACRVTSPLEDFHR